MTETFDEVILFDNKPALFTNARIDRNTVPHGYYAYDLRHGDRGNAVEIARFVGANHFGTVITRDPIKVPSDGQRMKSRDLNFAGGDSRDMKSFMEKYPPIAKPPKSHER